MTAYQLHLVWAVVTAGLCCVGYMAYEVVAMLREDKPEDLTAQPVIRHTIAVTDAEWSAFVDSHQEVDQ